MLRRIEDLEVSLNLVSSGIPSPLRRKSAGQAGFSSICPSRQLLWSSCTRYVADYGHSARLVPDGDGFKRASHWDTALEVDDCGRLASRHSGLEGGIFSAMARNCKHAQEDDDATALESVRTSLGSVADGPQEVVRECCDVASEICGMGEQDATGCFAGDVIKPSSKVDHRFAEEVARFSFLGPCRAVTLAAELMHSKLRMLELEGNYITSVGVRALAPALKTMGALRYVGLSWNAIADEAVEELMLALSRGKCALSFVELDLSNNRICNAGVKVMTKKIADLPALQKLSVQHNFFDVASGHRLVKMGKPRVKVQIADTYEGRAESHHRKVCTKSLPISACSDLDGQHSTAQDARENHAKHAAAGSGANVVHKHRRHVAKSASESSVTQVSGKRGDAQVSVAHKSSDSVTSVIMPVRRPGKSDASIVPVRFPNKAAQALPGRVFSKTTLPAAPSGNSETGVQKVVQLPKHLGSGPKIPSSPTSSGSMHSISDHKSPT